MYDKIVRDSSNKLVSSAYLIKIVNPGIILSLLRCFPIKIVTVPFRHKAKHV